MSTLKEFDCTVENVAVKCVASVMHDGNYWGTAAIEGGLSYGFVMMRAGTTKLPKYKTTQAIRITPRGGQLMKGETPVEILGLVLPIEKLFEHIVKTLVEFSDDSRTNQDPKPKRKRA